MCGRPVDRDHDGAHRRRVRRRVVRGEDKDEEKSLLSSVENATKDGGEDQSAFHEEDEEEEEQGPYLLELSAEEWRAKEWFLSEAEEAVRRPDAGEFAVMPLRKLKTSGEEGKEWGERKEGVSRGGPR